MKKSLIWFVSIALVGLAVANAAPLTQNDIDLSDNISISDVTDKSELNRYQPIVESELEQQVSVLELMSTYPLLSLNISNRAILLKVLNVQEDPQNKNNLLIRGLSEGYMPRHIVQLVQPKTNLQIIPNQFYFFSVGEKLKQTVQYKARFLHLMSEEELKELENQRNQLLNNQSESSLRNYLVNYNSTPDDSHTRILIKVLSVFKLEGRFFVKGKLLKKLSRTTYEYSHPLKYYPEILLEDNTIVLDRFEAIDLALDRSEARFAFKDHAYYVATGSKIDMQNIWYSSSRPMAYKINN